MGVGNKGNNKDLFSKRKSFFGEELVVVNIGIKPFYEDLKKQKALNHFMKISKNRMSK